MKPNYIYGAIAIILLTALAILISRPDREALPERIVAESKHAAQQMVWDKEFGSVMGTGSMHPFIPRGDPREVVAYTLLSSKDFADIRKGNFISHYNDEWQRVVHAAEKRTPNGWIVKGWANQFADPYLVTEENFIGIVGTVIIWER